MSWAASDIWAMWLATFTLGVRNLLLHKLRSFLTMLGTILGVASVIAMLAVGEGSKREAIEQIRQLGATNVIIRSVKPERVASDDSSTSGSPAARGSVQKYGLLHKDYDLLTATIPRLNQAVPIALVRRDARYQGRGIPNGRILGTTPEYLTVKNLALWRGRFLTEPDLQSTSNVAVLGLGAARSLFSYEDPVGKAVHLGRTSYRVVGVLDTQTSGAATPGAIGQQDFNNDIYIPISAARRRFGELQQTGTNQFEWTQLSEITLSVDDENLVSQTAAMVRGLLKQSHPDGKDYEIQVPLELLQQAEREKRIWNLVLGSIAGISLLVGGIGIMNIMLATVTERTREIGIRRALGAQRRDIVAQFLVESTVLSTSGGVIGVVVGVAAPVAVTMMSEIQTALSLWSVLLAFSISVGIGVVFGVYPAQRAALMDPIEALRHQ